MADPDVYLNSPEARALRLSRDVDPYYSVPGHENLPIPSSRRPEPSTAIKVAQGTASAFDNTIGGIPAFVAGTAQHAIGRPVHFGMGMLSGMSADEALKNANAIDEDWQRFYERGLTPAGNLSGTTDTPGYRNELSGQIMRGAGEHVIAPAVKSVAEATGLPETDVTNMANIGMLAAGPKMGKVPGAAAEAAIPEVGLAKRVLSDVGPRGVAGLESGFAKDRLAARGPANLYDPFRVASGVDPTEVGKGAVNAVDRAIAKVGDIAAPNEAQAAVALAKGAAPQASDVPAGVDMAAPTKDFVQHGKPVPPMAPPPSPEAVTIAQTDTRMGADAVKKRLPIIVPEQERVVGGIYTPGAPDGRRWSELSPEELKVRGPGANFTDNELQGIWDQTLSEVSEAGRQAVANTGATWKAFPAQMWDKALRLPLRSQLWYELSGEAFIDRLPDLRYNEHMMFLDLVGATSARARPGENLERSLGVLSQRLRGVPVDVDVTIPSTVTAALRRDGRNVSSDLANKTGMFSDTLALTGGLPVRYPISVNDVWVGKAFGISDDMLSSNQALHEVFGKYTNKLRDLVNNNPSQPMPHQSWNLQARQWVEMRAADEGVDTSLAATVDGSDYAGEWDKVVKKLEAAGIDVPDGKLTRDILMDPRTADALRTTTPGFRNAPKATVEFGTLLTPVGKQAADAFERARKLDDKNTQAEYLAAHTTSMYKSARGDTPWEALVRVAKGDASNVTRIYYPTTDDPYAISGTFGGAAAPNIRIPLRDMTPDQIAYFNAVAGKGLRQKAMAAVEIHRLQPGEPVAEGAVPSYAVRFDFDGPVPEQMLTDFAKTLGDGYELSAMRYPDGMLFDINPRFGENGPEVPSVADVDRAVDAISQTYGVTNPKVFDIGYKSEYGKNYVEDPGDGTGYKQVIAATTKAWQDEALSRLRDLTEGKVKDVYLRKYLKGDDGALKAGAAAAGVPVSGLTGRAGTVRKGLQQRLGDHADVERQFANVGKEVEAKLKALVPKWNRRHETIVNRFNRTPPEERASARGYDVDAYRGSLKDIQHYGVSSSPEGYYGNAGTYFTSSPADASYNYARPDMADAGDMSPHDLLSILRETKPDATIADVSGPNAAALAAEHTRRVNGDDHAGAVYPSRLRMRNPVKVGGEGETVFSGRDLHKVASLTGEALAHAGIPEDVATAVMGAIDKASTNGSMGAQDFDLAIRNAAGRKYGARIGNVIADVFRRSGFDGIDMDASVFSDGRAKGYRTPHSEGARHYIIFNPDDIRGRFAKFGTGTGDELPYMRASGGAVTPPANRDTNPAVSRALALTSEF